MILTQTGQTKKAGFKNVIQKYVQEIKKKKKKQ